MFDVSAQQQHHRLQLLHVDVQVVVRSANGDFWRVVVGVNDFKRAIDGRRGLPLGAVARLCGTHLHDAFLSAEGDGVAAQSGGSFEDFERDRQSRGGRGVELEGLVADELVGYGLKLNELRCQSGRGVAHHEVVEAAVRAAEEEHAVPHGGVEAVAATWGEACVDALYLRDGLKLARAVEVGEECHRALAAVGFKVNHDFPAGPRRLAACVVDVDGQGVVGQHDAADERGAWVVARGDEIDAAVLRG